MYLNIDDSAKQMPTPRINIPASYGVKRKFCSLNIYKHYNFSILPLPLLTLQYS